MCEWSEAAALGVPKLAGSCVHVPLGQDYWLPVHDASTQRLWLRRIAQGPVSAAGTTF